MDGDGGDDEQLSRKRGRKSAFPAKYVKYLEGLLDEDDAMMKPATALAKLKEQFHDLTVEDDRVKTKFGSMKTKLTSKAKRQADDY